MHTANPPICEQLCGQSITSHMTQSTDNHVTPIHRENHVTKSSQSRDKIHSQSCDKIHSQVMWQNPRPIMWQNPRPIMWQNPQTIMWQKSTANTCGSLYNQSSIILRHDMSSCNEQQTWTWTSQSTSVARMQLFVWGWTGALKSAGITYFASRL